MSLRIFLFFVIFLEGYIVLSAELLALRLLIPFVGNATDTVAIVIAAVLMPLAFGYYVGGAARPPLRRRLVFNLAVSGVILSLGLSHIVMGAFFSALGLGNDAGGRLLATALYALAFLVVPVFLLGQTVPLASNFMRSQNLSLTTGRILFFSTLGSFMGAVFCTIALMPSIGVHYSVSITIACTTLLVLLLSPRLPDRYSTMAVCALALSLVLNSGFAMSSLGIVANNQYNTVQIIEAGTGKDAVRLMRVNNTYASAAYTDPTRQDERVFPYIAFLETALITPLRDADGAYDILILGGGAMTLGADDTKNKYTFVDIDPTMEGITENYITGTPLPPNKRFVAEEARAFLSHSGEKFDLIIMDIYQDRTGVPAHTVTREFFESVKSALKPQGIAAGNFIASPNFSDVYSARLDHTIRAVFPFTNRHINASHDPWDTSPNMQANVIYIMHPAPSETDGLYTDNLNRSFLDKGRSRALLRHHQGGNLLPD